MTSLPYHYAEREPPTALADAILAFWHFEAAAPPPAGAPYTVWPDGCTSIAVADGAGVPPMVLCVGPRASAFQPPVIPGRRLLGLRLWPDMTRALLGVAPRTLRDQLGLAPPTVAALMTPLVEQLAAQGEATAALAAIERWATENLPVATPPDRRVRAAVRAITTSRGTIALADLAREAGASTRQLQRIFPDVTGLTVSEFARVRRLRESLVMRLDPAANPWSRIAAERGFTDHAHLTREFIALGGLRPTDAARQLARTQHLDVRP